MTQEFVSYELALEMKQIGFDETCLAVYEDKKWQLVESKNSMSYELCLKTDVFPAPTFSQCFRFFREKQYYSEITTECTQVDGSIGFSWRIWKPWLIEEWSPENGNDEWSYKTYEECEQACLVKLIEIVKENGFHKNIH
jgi:hypothetical protein